jgi:hypothetical protein
MRWLMRSVRKPGLGSPIKAAQVESASSPPGVPAPRSLPAGLTANEGNHSHHSSAAMKKVRKRDERNAMNAYYHKFAVLLLLGGLYARYSFLAFASALLKSTTGGRLSARERAFP